MKISVELTLMPLQQDFEAPIIDFKHFKKHKHR